MASPVQIKVCGVTRLEDVAACHSLGVNAVGLNFWSGTARQVGVSFAREAVQRFPDIEFVAVFVNEHSDRIAEVRRETGIVWVQLHGDEAPAELEPWLPTAYKAIGVSGENDVARAAGYGGDRILLDARVPGAMPGGTGHSFDWSLATGLAATRTLTLAGGLSAGNVREAIETVRPARVDVASGVESSPGIKEMSKLEAFVNAVCAAG